MLWLVLKRFIMILRPSIVNIRTFIKKFLNFPVKCKYYVIILTLFPEGCHPNTELVKVTVCYRVSFHSTLRQKTFSSSNFLHIPVCCQTNIFVAIWLGYTKWHSFRKSFKNGAEIRIRQRHFVWRVDYIVYKRLFYDLTCNMVGLPRVADAVRIGPHGLV